VADVPSADRPRVSGTLDRPQERESVADDTPADAGRTSAAAQVARDRELAAGAHELSQDEHATLPRKQAARTGGWTARTRLQAADERDARADARDHAALTRDRLADERSLAMREIDAASQRYDKARARTPADVVVRAATQRKRAAERRALAAEQRELASEDRRDAARDRADAARERVDALADRELLTEDLQRERRLRQQALVHQRRAEQLARTLQRSLSPPRLPQIAGLEVAVHYEPSAPEEVGGDFYDLFPLSATRTGFFLGDVCGKGPEAAAVTSLARYTMRTAAMLHETPDAILADLNAALLVDGAQPLQTCTVVYGQVDDGSDAAAVTLAVAGHPPPLVVRAHGAVETTRAHGTLLGAFPNPAFVTCQVMLDVGDAIVICSDGIHDTQIDGLAVDEQRVLDLLSGTPHASAQELVDRLVHALRATQRPLRDDVAVLVLGRTAP